MEINWGAASFILGLIVIALQALNLYVANSIKLWALEKFVTKTDFLDTLTLWSKGEKKGGLT